MNLIDSHAHLFLEEFAEDLPLVIQRAKQAGVSHIFMPNIDSTTIEPLLKTCDMFPNYCFPMIGLHPTSVDDNYLQELEIVHRQLEENAKRYVAIGEIGLDLYWDKTYLNEQLIAFEQQIEWALQYNLPIVIHVRDAFEYIYKVLKPYRQTALKGVFHSFTGNMEEMKQLLEFTNFYIGINGVVTFKKSHLPDVLKYTPMERLLIETDAPYLAPVPHRGKVNHSIFMKEICATVAECHGVTTEEMANITYANACKLFNMQ